MNKRALAIAYVWAVSLLATCPLAAVPPPPAGYTGSCTASECHGEFAKRQSVHAPVAQGACDSCHEATNAGEHTFALTTEEAELCLDCHDEDDFPGSLQHAPFSRGECTACHDPHGGDGPHLLMVESVAEVCADCHDEVLDDLKHLHGPVDAGECTSCHNPHAADHPKLLFAETDKLCLKCHEDMAKRISQGVFVHEPVRGECTTCHGAHGGENRMFLVTAGSQLCFDCHEEIEETIEDAEVPHKAVTTDRACMNCHNPHASGFDHGLIKETMSLCTGCHNKRLGEGEGSTSNIALQLAERPRHHGPIEQKDCVACHEPHGGANFRLLSEAYPKRFYTPFKEESYAICFSCHEVELLEDEETDEATGFRNGERNLHFLHVNRPYKGRTCRACHEPHAGRKAKMIAESVRFGAWMLPINFEQSETGGSCAPGCHRAYSYDRRKPVENFTATIAEP